MSYIDIDGDFLEDILTRKEFYVLKNKREYIPDDNIIPLFMIDNELRKGNNLQFHSHQIFVKNFINVDTPYSRLLMKHSTGSGKTIGAIGIAMQFIKYYRKEEIIGTPKESIGSVYIIAFEGAKKAFQKDLLRFPSLGFVTRKELLRWDKLREQALSNIQADVDRAFEFGNKIKKRLSNRKGNGFFKFIGYKALVNRLFISNESISNMSEEEIKNNIEKGTIKYNKPFLDEFKDSLIICDEIHNVYNSLQKNNWGIGIQTILDNDPSTRAVFMSATPINNNPTEIVDLLNLLLPPKLRITKSDLFTDTQLKDGALDKLKELSIGRVSYLIDKNPAFFPKREFLGEKINGIKYIKFIRCPLNERQYKAYKSIYNEENKTLPQDARYILDFILPSPDGPDEFIYKFSDIKKIAIADQQWKLDNNIDVNINTPTGELLRLDNLKNVSNKYYVMLNDIINLIKGRQGKIMIYHNYVNMSGVLFIREILLRNGIIDEYMSSSDNTLCSVCGLERKTHNDDIIVSVNNDVAKTNKHTFKPVRFIAVHSELDRNTVEKSIDKYNRSSNSMGDDFMILIGSRMIKESYDLKAIRHMMIMSRPDNIPMLIQIIGRAVRKHSHISLPSDMHNVFISIYTSCLPDMGLSYSEIKYRDKVIDYEVIQKIERIFHENAVDSVINYKTIKPGLESDDLGDIDFTPSLINDKKKTEFKLSELNLSTFNIYHSDEEIKIITYIIKRGFIETSHVWKWEDLLTFIKEPNFNVEYDTRLIHTDNVVIALSKLLWEQDTEILNPYIEDTTTKINIIDKIFDPIDKRFIMQDGTTYVISHIGEYYMLLPLINNVVKKNIDMPYRLNTKYEDINFNVITYLKNEAVNFNYGETKKTFVLKYEKVPMENLSDAVCDYGIDFHVRFIEESIVYVFNNWTDLNTKKSDYHDFYFKMLYYYDVMGLIIFADSSKEFIYRLYEDYILENELDKTTKILGKERDKQNLINLISRNISKSTCSSCPKANKKIYEEILPRSLERFDVVVVRKKEDINKVTSDILPVGHFLQKNPKFYHPDKGWFPSPEYLVESTDWIENPIVIGYNVKSKTGIHVRFKIRNPVQQIKIHKDARLIEKGAICSTKPKTFLLDLCKKLKISINSNVSVNSICEEIKIKLLNLELQERKKGTKVKYFYSHYEILDIDN